MQPNSEGKARAQIGSSRWTGWSAFAQVFDREYHLPILAQGRVRLALGAGLYLVLVFLCYLPILPGSFVMDDHRLLVDENCLVNGEGGLGSVFFTGDFPLSTIGWWLQWRLWGENPAGYHVVNLLLHVTSVVLLWQLLVKLQIPGAWLAAAMFAVHPVCVNSVARIAELKNTLSLPFFLLSFLAYLNFETGALYPAHPPPAGGRSARGQATLWYGLSLLAFVLALLSKTTTIMLPVVLLGCAAWQRRQLTRRDLLHTGPFFLLSLAFGLMSMWYQKHQALLGETLPPSNFLERLVTAGWNFWFYLGKALLPLNLSFVYLRWEPDVTTLTAYLPGLLVLAAFGFCWRYRRRWGRHALFGLGYFLIALFPALGFFDTQFLVYFQVSDHLQYLPLMAPLVLVTALLASALPRTLLPVVVGALILVLSNYTLLRAEVFSSQEKLMRDTLRKNPSAWAAHNDLGVVLAKQQNYPAAEAEFAASLALRPDYAGARLNLGQVLLLEEKYGEARDHLMAGLSNNPANSEFHTKLSTALASLGRPHEAIIQLQVALRLETKVHVNTRMALAALLYQTGQHREALNQYRLIVSAQPDLIEALNNMAWLLATSPDDSVRNGTEAVNHAERACLLSHFKDLQSVGTLAAAYAEAGRFPEAVITADFAVRLATAAHNAQLVSVNRQLLELYRAGRAWHQPATAP